MKPLPLGEAGAQRRVRVARLGSSETSPYPLPEGEGKSLPLIFFRISAACSVVRPDARRQVLSSRGDDLFKQCKRTPTLARVTDGRNLVTNVQAFLRPALFQQSRGRRTFEYPFFLRCVGGAGHLPCDVKQRVGIGPV